MDRTSNIRLNLDADSESLIEGNRELKAMDKYLESIGKRVRRFEHVQLLSQVNMIDRMTQSVKNLSRALDQIHLRYLAKPAVYRIIVKEKVEIVRKSSIVGSKKNENQTIFTKSNTDIAPKPWRNTNSVLIKGNLELKAMDKYLGSIEKRVKRLERVQLMSQVNIIDRMTESVKNLARALDKVHSKFLAKPTFYQVIIREQAERVNKSPVANSGINARTKEKNNQIQDLKNQETKPKTESKLPVEPKKIGGLESFYNFSNYTTTFPDKFAKPTTPSKFGSLELLIDLGNTMGYADSSKEESRSLWSVLTSFADLESNLSDLWNYTKASSQTVNEIYNASGASTNNRTPEWIKNFMGFSNRIGPPIAKFLDAAFKQLDIYSSVMNVSNSETTRELFKNTGGEVLKWAYSLALGKFLKLPRTPVTPAVITTLDMEGQNFAKVSGEGLGDLLYDMIFNFGKDSETTVAGMKMTINEIGKYFSSLGEDIFSFFFPKSPPIGPHENLYPSASKVDSNSAVSGKPVEKKYPRNFEKEFVVTEPNKVPLSLKSFSPFRIPTFNPYSFTDPNPNNTKLAPKKLSPEQIDGLVGYLKNDSPKKESATVNMPAGAIQITVNQGIRGLEEIVTEVSKKFHVEFKKSLQNSKPKFLAN